MKENFLLSLNYFENANGDITDNILNTDKYSPGLASMRLQQLPALKAAQSLKFKVKCLSIRSNRQFSLSMKEKPTICLIGKLTASKLNMEAMIEANLILIKKLKEIGVPILLSYCDNHARKNDIHGFFYRELLHASDHIVTPTIQLAESAKSLLRPEINFSVIEDPWQIAQCKPSRQLGEELNLIWFGQNSNAKYLDKALKLFKIKGKSAIPCNIKILGSKPTIHLFKTRVKSYPEQYPDWIYHFIEWDGHKQPQQLKDALTTSDIALIPSDPSDPSKNGSSHNRLVDAARAGCIVIASPLSSYQELSKIAILGNNFPKMLDHAIRNFNIINNNNLRLRSHLLARFSPSSNQKKWRNLFQLLTNQNKE